jgi:XTP/dITP diphosphohydrolase
MSPSGQRTWTLASSNAGKLAEYQSLFRSLPIELRALDAASAEVPDETGITFVENALLKARHAARLVRGPALADDSGLCVDVLNGAPGVQSARFAGAGASDADNIALLLERLAGIAVAERTAAFHCVIVAVRDADDPIPWLATGRWQGRIALQARGDNGFGYDPVFIDPESGLTAAELTAAQKNARSHRSRAAAEFLRQWQLPEPGAA